MEKQPGARVENDPLLAFSIEPSGAAAPSQLEQPVAAVRLPDAEATRARINQLEKTLDRNSKEIAALKSQVATLVGATSNKSSRAVSAIVAGAVGVGFGAWAWTIMSSTPLVPASPLVTAAAAIVPAPVAVAEPPIAEPVITPVALVAPDRNVQSRVPARVDYVGTLSIDSDPPGDVFIDRQPSGRTPMRAANLRAGSHLVWIERDGYRRFTRVVEVPADRVSRVVAALELAQR